MFLDRSTHVPLVLWWVNSGFLLVLLSCRLSNVCVSFIVVEYSCYLITRVILSVVFVKYDGMILFLLMLCDVRTGVFLSLPFELFLLLYHLL